MTLLMVRASQSDFLVFEQLLITCSGMTAKDVTTPDLVFSGERRQGAVQSDPSESCVSR